MCKVTPVILHGVISPEYQGVFGRAAFPVALAGEVPLLPSGFPDDLTHRMYSLISFRKSTPPQDREIVLYYG